MNLSSVELAPGVTKASGAGHLKRVREPVIFLAGVTRNANALSAAVGSFHAGLEPGPYDLTDGTRVLVPASLVGAEHRHHPHVTLEVIP